eukprot:Opistho-1_new@79571
MLKRILTYCLIVFGLAVLYLSTSKDMMQKISDARNDHDEWWGAHFAYEGDLVGMSYLYYVKDFHKPRERVFMPRKCDKRKGVNLVLWGDSYTMHFRDSNFCADRYQYGRRFFGDLEYQLDTSLTNVLVIECTERIVREYFVNGRMYNEVKPVQAEKKVSFSDGINYSVKHAAVFGLPSIKIFFNPHINRNIEYNLFNYNFISPIRKTKALISYKLFNRASGDAVLSKKGDRLFYNKTLDKKETTGFNCPLSDNEVNKIVKLLNEIDAHYKAAGFDEVYLSLIPNAVTIYQPVGYNMLIPRIQNHQDLRMKCIDVYTPFLQKPDGMFWKGDTHWSNAGADVWLDIVNRIITDTAYSASR